VNSLLGGFTSGVSAGLSKVGATATNFLKTAGFGSANRGKNLPTDGVADGKTTTQAEQKSKPGEKDWRVRLSLPRSFGQEFMGPVIKTEGFVFPYTPTIMVSHSASYTPLNPVHTNYTINAYNYSTVDNITMTGDFYCQNGLEARYWVAAIHYLRSVTKMSYGSSSSNAGSPPPVVLLNGYGDFVFKNIPVVVTSVQFDLPKDVDYISCTLDSPELEGQVENFDYNTVAWAPTQSQVTVQVVPQIARSSMSQFNMDSFIKGEYLKKSGGFL
jgi:hypothetical protein